MAKMTKPIIDISYYQTPALINYDQLAGAVDGVILRAAYGTGVPGKWQGTEPAFERHYAEFTKRGVPVGAYHYITEYQPIAEQVAVFLNAVKGKTLKLGYWCDVEYERGAEKLTAKSVIGWMDGVEAKVGECGVYAANWCWRSIMQDEYARYKTRKLWCAAYTSSIIVPPGWDGNWYLWQYTSSGRLPGYGGNLDINKLNPAWIGGSYMLNVQALSQKDARWASVKLGTSASTIGGYGCLITCVAMVMNYYGHDTDPARLNAELVRVGGYQNGNLLVFNKVSDIFPTATMDWDNYATSGVLTERINTVLANGRPVIVQVDYDPADADIDQHWVVVIGKDARGYVIADPIDGRVVALTDRYKAPLRMVVYNGSHPGGDVPPEPPAEIKVGTQVKTLVNLNIRKGAGVGFERWATAPKGTVLDVLEIKGDWVRVGWNQWALSQLNGVRYLE